ncbi:MAG TPA: nucleotide disphospho-sugar-binding domain-containing protein [Kofleriaceae bacterium]|nr:nucleotide disphospho-sugar-binding domain-containing protein [Kofleriaceae bacterium]
MRFLFVVPPLTGHINPTISVARALEARGHEVAWVGHPGKVRPLLPAGARLFTLPEDATADHAARVQDKAATTRGAAALKFLWEDFLVPLARSMKPGIAAAVDEFAPDVMCCDQQAVAGGLVARARGLPWATLATTSAGISDPLGALPQVKKWFEDLIYDLEREAGLPRAGELSPHLVIAFTTSALVPGTFPAHYKLVGPSIADRPETTPFPFEQLRRPCVLVSMGTVNTDLSGRFYAITAEALADQPYQVVLVAPPELVPRTPANFLVQRYVPQLALLSRVDAVVCHGGHNTTCEALAHGLPLAIAPIKDDQPIVADQVVAAGAGVRLKFGRVQSPELCEAVARVLADPALRAGAARVGDSFIAAGGAPKAAEHLEALGAKA